MTWRNKLFECLKLSPNKKVLLRERKRHTARRVAVAISCYSGGGGVPVQKIFFQSEHVSSQIWCQKIFPLLGGGGSLDKKFFSQSEHVSSQIWCQKCFPLLGGGPLTKIFFPSLNMYQAKSGVKNFSLYWGGVPRQKFFFPVWTCIMPNLVSKIFPFTGGGPLTKIFFPSLNMYQAKSGVKNFSLYWDRVPPPKIWDMGPPQKSKTWNLPPQNLRHGTPQKSETWDPPWKSETWDPPPIQGWIGYPPPEMWTDWNYYLPPSFGWRAVTI